MLVSISRGEIKRSVLRPFESTWTLGRMSSNAPATSSTDSIKITQLSERALADGTDLTYGQEGQIVMACDSNIRRRVLKEFYGLLCAKLLKTRNDGR